jgi:hypothetical protein
MMNRLLIVKGLFLATALTACGTVTEREYTDNDVLERPPALARQRASDDKVEQVRSETPKKAEKVWRRMSVLIAKALCRLA